MTHEKLKRLNDLNRKINELKTMISDFEIKDIYTYLGISQPTLHYEYATGGGGTSRFNISVPIDEQVVLQLHRDHLEQLKKNLWIAEQQFKAL